MPTVKNNGRGAVGNALPCQGNGRSLIAIASSPLVAGDIAGALLRGRLATAWRMARTAGRRADLGAEKILSRKYRYVWLCNPKVASRSIMAALLDVTPDAELFRETSAAELFALRPEARSYYCFAFVRHPFTRALSFHAELHFFASHYAQGAQLQHKKEKSSRFFRDFHGLAETAGFGDYCRWLHTPYASDAVAERHFLSQHVQLRLADGRLPDFIGRFENLGEDFQQIAERLGLPKPALPVLNTMAGWQPAHSALHDARAAASARLTQHDKRLLAMRYARDFELGGYSDAPRTGAANS